MSDLINDFLFPKAARFESVKSSPIRDILNIISRGDVISFAGGIPDASLFEYDDIKESYEWVLSNQAGRALQYASTPGEPELREQAAARLSRTVATTPDHIQVTTASQEGLFLVGQAMISPGDVVLVERPTYLAALQAFAMAGARLISVESDDNGVVVADLERKIAEHKPTFVYLIPTFQNPSGRTMPLDRREQVAEVLLRTGTALVEDDPYGELRYEGETVPQIAAMPGMSRQTLLLNSMSKVMAPGIRMGWIRGEGEILRTLEIVKQAVALQSPVIDQLAVAHYLATYDLDDHVRRVAACYKERRDALYSGLTAMLPNAEINNPVGGMFLWVRLGGDVDTQPLLHAAVEKGVAFVPGWSFYADNPDRSTMRMSYVTNSPETIAEGLRRLSQVMVG